MRFLRYISILITILIAKPAAAQFYVTGDDPGKAEWNSIETDNFKVIYPKGADSLARTYARKIEQFRIPVSLTSGYVSGEGNGRKLPVVLHAYNAANGSVAWAPSRMDLFSIPSAYNPEPMPWNTMLSVHESRHVTQMQFGMTKALKPGNWFFGEMWNILASLLYPGLSLMEGDAVITETAWTSSGRGRTASFLNYYWVAFDSGDFRKWYGWRYVSQKKNAPDHYALGYLTVGGFRYLYDCPEYMSEGYHLSARRPYNLGAFNTMTRKLTGKKFNDAFMEVCDTMYTLWKEDAEARKPYIVSEQITPETRMYTDYTDNLVVGNDVYAIKKGHVNVPTLVRIDSTGKEHRISSFGYSVSKLEWSPYFKKIYWSETKTDKRWNLESESKIRFMTKDAKYRKTLKDTALLYNPSAQNDGARIAAVQYDFRGKSFINILLGGDGKIIDSFQAPDSLQLVETAWIEDEIYTTAISDNGYGIYRISKDDGSCTEILAPQPVMIKDFNSYGNELMFTCDRTGADELYHLDPLTGDLRQKTSTRYGSEDFRYSDDGRWLYYSSQTINGMKIFRTPSDSLMNRPADFTELYRYPIAEKITAQEKDIAESRSVRIDKDVTISEPKRYRKLPHTFNVHSWAPVYVNVDNIMSTSFDQIWQAASLGATGIIQNRLSTMTGEFGYSAHKDPYNQSKWRHSAHARFSYSGLYPIIEAKVNFNDRAARQYSTYAYLMSEDQTGMEISSRELRTPYVEGLISAYIPFRFSSGGWFKGITPRVTYRIGNDMFNSNMTIMGMEEHIAPDIDGESHNKYQNPVFLGYRKGKNTFRHSISGSLSAYTIQNTASSAAYPRWGIGMEIGAMENIESRDFLSPMGYAYLYGYLPGITREQGIRLAAMTQVKLDNKAVFGQPCVSILPRGLSSNANLTSWLSIRNPIMTKVSFDYAIPVYIGEIFIGGGIFAIKRLSFNPHFDCTFISGTDNLWSAGADLNLDMHSILTLDWPFSFGVRFCWNGGNAFNATSEASGLKLKKWYIGPNFNVTF